MNQIVQMAQKQWSRNILQVKAWSHSWQIPAIISYHIFFFDLVEAESWKFESDWLEKIVCVLNILEINNKASLHWWPNAQSCRKIHQDYLNFGLHHCWNWKNVFPLYPFSAGLSKWETISQLRSAILHAKKIRSLLLLLKQSSHFISYSK